MPDPHLKYHLQLKVKEDVGVGVWGFKGGVGREGNLVGMEKQMFAGPGKDNGTQRGILTNRRC